MLGLFKSRTRKPKKFRLISKEARAKFQKTKTLIYQLIVITGLVWSPWLVKSYEEGIERDRNQIILDQLPIEEKWRSVKNGAAEVKCQDDAAEVLKNEGIDSTGADGLAYALDHGICKFRVSTKGEFSQDPCKSFNKQLRGQWISSECMFGPTEAQDDTR